LPPCADGAQLHYHAAAGRLHPGGRSFARADEETRRHRLPRGILGVSLAAPSAPP
jgi:hypothetical protein